MSFKQMMEDDLDLFYNSDEFADSAEYQGKTVSILFLDDMEVFENSQKVIQAKSSNVPNIAIGDTFTTSSNSYKVLNFDYVDDTKLERIISLNEA